jgi:hypothetical protein
LTAAVGDCDARPDQQPVADLHRLDQIDLDALVDAARIAALSTALRELDDGHLSRVLTARAGGWILTSQAITCAHVDGQLQRRVGSGVPVDSPAR